MNASSVTCCSSPTAAPRGHHRATRAGRLVGLFKWAFPGVTLALMPKCPACLAAYVALGTGLSLSLSAAWYLRTTAIAVCIATLLFLTIRAARRLGARPCP